jgi:hypothetical protein
MKKIYLSILSCGAIGIILLASNAGGPASSGNRATGAPGDGSSTCVTCHNSGGAFGNVSIEMLMTDVNGNAKADYIADSVYDITITVTNAMGTPAGYGFQMICLDGDDENYNGWANASSNAQLSTSAGRNYIEHDGISTSNEFSVEWTAPTVLTGDVTFYIGANAVNGASGNSNDNAALADFIVSEIEGEEPNSVVELNQEGLAVYPNPTTGVINIGNDQNASIQVFNTEGKLLQLETLNTNQIDLTNQPTGFYMLINKETGSSQKVSKL